MNTAEWIVIGLLAWFVVSVPAGLIIGPVLKRCSQAREAQG